MTEYNSSKTAHDFDPESYGSDGLQYRDASAITIRYLNTIWREFRDKKTSPEQRPALLTEFLTDLDTVAHAWREAVNLAEGRAGFAHILQGLNHEPLPLLENSEGMAALVRETGDDSGALLALADRARNSIRQTCGLPPLRPSFTPSSAHGAGPSA